MHLEPMKKPHRGDAFGIRSQEGVCPDCAAHSTTRTYKSLIVTEMHHDNTCPNKDKITAAIDIRDNTTCKENKK